MVIYPASSLHQVQPVKHGVSSPRFFWIQSLVRNNDNRQALLYLDIAIRRIRADPGKINARKTNAVGGPAAAVSAQRRIEPQAAAGRCMPRPAPRAASDWRAA